MKYGLKDLKFIQDDFVGFLNDCEDAKARFDMMFPEASSTWTYDRYNIFSLTSGSQRFYKLYNEIKKLCRVFLKTDEPLWIQSWLNYHKMDEVLDWHDHGGCSAHGYVSINPMKTKTVFETFEIDNKVGRLYIGNPYINHKVEVLEDFNMPRVTIAFDISKEKDLKNNNSTNLSLIPI